MPALPAFPEWQAPDAPMPTVLFDSADTFVANTLRMKKAKLHDVDETPEDETPDDEEEEEGDAEGGA